MALAIVTTRDVPDRYRGFLASLMLEVAPTVYISPRMNPGVRSRVWETLSSWHAAEPQGSVTLIWRDLNEVGGVGIKTLGVPSRELMEVDGIWLVRKPM